MVPPRQCCEKSAGECAKRGGGVRGSCDRLTVCLNATAIALGSTRTESASSVTANEFMHLPRRYRNAHTRSLRARPHAVCSKRAVRCEPGIDADSRDDRGPDSVSMPRPQPMAAPISAAAPSLGRVAHWDHRRTARRCPALAVRGFPAQKRPSSGRSTGRRAPTDGIPATCGFQQRRRPHRVKSRPATLVRCVISAGDWL